MGFWNALVNVLVFSCAAAFALVGVVFLLFPLTGTTLIGRGDKIVGGPNWQMALMGLIFLLAAAPMFYYVFSKNARGLPPARKKKSGEGQPPA